MKRAAIWAVALLVAACGDQSSTDIDGAPVLQSTLPARDASGVALQTEVTVEFNESIALPADTTGMFTLAHGSGVMGGTLMVDDRTLRFKPFGVLDPGTRYQVVVRGVVDRAGQAIATPVNWSFTTAGRTPPAHTAALLLSQVARLAADSMAGRGSGTADEARTAQYLQAQFTAFGLQAYATNFLQSFSIAPSRVGGRTGVTSQNVIALLPGNGALRNEWVVLGAHYDHVGVRLVGGQNQIFNGADDNASGTALLLEVARQLQAYFASGGLGNEPRRSIMFQAYGAEELGLLGSEFYCAQPAAPLNAIAAMLNFDMVGRLRNNELFVGGLPTATEWSKLIAQYNATALSILPTDCAGCTDFACFRRSQRPVLWFFTGMHPQYHQPTDDIELIEADGMARIADLVTRVVINVATRAGGVQ